MWKILEVLHDDDRKTFSASLLVDKTWNQLATKVLYKDICLDSTSMIYFTRPTQRRHLKCPRSITINARVEFDGYSINSLRPHLSAMHNLLSFSFDGCFTEENDAESRCVVELAKILEALPLSVQYLELCVPYRFASPEYHHSRLFPVLSKTLPRLRGLRLECMTICPSLLESLQESCQQLESITIESLENRIQHSCADSDLRWYKTELSHRRFSCGRQAFGRSRSFSSCTELQILRPATSRSSWTTSRIRLHVHSGCFEQRNDSISIEHLLYG